MVKSVSTLFLFFSTLFTAQTYRVIYEAEFLPQKNTATFKRELMCLDIDAKSNKSSFYSLNRVQRDSLIALKKYQDLKAIEKPYLNFVTHKDEVTNMAYCTKMFGYDYCFRVQEAISWSPDNVPTLPVKGLAANYRNLRYAKTKFAGRAWRAIYTEEIGMPEGPYLFSGLPGLILTIASQDGEYRFTAVSIQQIPEMTYGSYKVNIKEKKYREFIKEFASNPGLFDMNITNEYGDQMKYEFKGKKDASFLDTNEYFKTKFQKYNNPIDPGLWVLIND